MEKRLLILSLLACLWQLGSAQSVQQIDFKTFESHLTTKSDTTYLYNFWATWCKPCIKEIPYLQQAKADHQQEKFQVVYVSLDFPDQMKLVESFVARKGLAPVWLLDEPDANSWIDKVSPKWTGAIPASLLVNRAKDQYEFYEGSFTQESLNAWIEENGE
ncbi:MAG: TlpA disulfide reductase family protein [Bacteroidota bacterium]